jgi:hypothetical protein
MCIIGDSRSSNDAQSRTEKAQRFDEPHSSMVNALVLPEAVVFTSRFVRLVTRSSIIQAHGPIVLDDGRVALIRERSGRSTLCDIATRPVIGTAAGSSQEQLQ